MNQILQWLATDAFGSFCINALFQIVLISLSSLALASLFRRNAVFRSGILGTGLILVLLCPLGTLISQRHEIGLARVDMSAFSYAPQELAPSVTPPQLSNPQNDAGPLNYPTELAYSTNLTEPAYAPQHIDLRELSPSLPNAKSVAIPSTQIDWSQTLAAIYISALLIWLCGASVLFIRLFTSWLNLCRLIRAAHPPGDELQHAFSAIQLRMSMKAPVRFRTSGQIESPFAAGIFRPTVVLPAALVSRLSSDKLAEVVLHELAHIARRDQAIIWLQHLAAAIYWPIPLIHLLNRQLAQAREEVCDNYVLGLHPATDYSRTLLSIAETFVPSRIPGAVGLFTSKWRLEQRIANLLDNRRIRTTHLRGRWALFAALLAILPATALLVSLQWAPAIAQEAETASPIEQRPIEELLRGTGDDLEVLLRGSVTAAPGSSLSNDMSATIALDYNGTHTDLVSPIRNGRFEAWLPVNRVQWYVVKIHISNDAGDRASRMLYKHELRKLSTNGVHLELRPPTRFVNVSTLLDDKPLPNTHVKASLNNSTNVLSVSGTDGVTRLGLLEDEELNQLTAWNDEGFIGGFDFSRKPVRDPRLDQYDVDMFACQKLPVHIVHGDGTPAANLEFVVQTSTGAPNYNFIGLPGNITATSDQGGNATWDWLPSWETRHQYVDIITDNLSVKEQDTKNGIQSVTLATEPKRKRIEGYVQSNEYPVAGIIVELSTFQTAVEHMTESLTTTTDSAGRFSIDVLPDSTYCVFVNDDQYVSNTIDLIPYDSKADRMNTPYLKLAEGTPVELSFTTGKQKRPFRLNSVNMESTHHYSYSDLKTGKSSSAGDGRRIVLSTGHDGKIKFRAAPGPLRISAFTPDWRKEETIQIVEGQTLFHTIHRESDEATEIQGKLTADGVDTSAFANARVFAGSRSDGYDEEVETTANADGSFKLTTKSSEVVVFAFSTDHKYAGSIITTDLNVPLTLQMRPTVAYRGRLVDEDGKPIEGHKVNAAIRFEAPDAKFHAAYRPTSLETQTNAEGEYEFKALPSQIQISFTADDFRDEDPNTVGMMEFITLDPVQNRPIATNIIPRRKHDPSKSDKPIDDRFAVALKDAQLGSYHLMVVCFDRSNKDCQRFCNAQLIDSVDNRLAASFMHLHLDTSDSQTAGFLQKRALQAPAGDQILVVTYNVAGDELKRQLIDVTHRDAADQVDDLINASAPTKQDARKKWSVAFEEAKKSNRRVWVRTSQRFCGPCITMSRWLDKHKSIIEKDFVVLKIDTALDENSAEFDKQLSKDRLVGIPFHAMLDADENLIIDSYSPLGNIGCVSGYDGKQHFLKMLQSARINLTDDDINELLESIED